MRLCFKAPLLAVAILFPACADAPPRPQLNYVGKLSENGTPVTGTRTFIFTIVDETGTELWTSGNQNVAVANGLYATALGSADMPAIPPALLGRANLLLQLTVGGQVMAPGVAIIPAFQAQSAWHYLGSLSGDVTGSETGTLVGSLQGYALDLSTAPATGQGLVFNGTKWVAGAVAATGGAPGAQGPAGPAGSQGPVGPSGPTGAQGPAGLAGSQGPIGPSGPTGAQGPAGPQGPVGVQGLAGTDGRTIYSGISDPLPAQGANGDFYLNTASSMLFGPKAGNAWPAGQPLMGQTGPAGATGSTGSTGAAGPTGTQGPQGAQGPQGPQGIQGIQGSQGAVGPVGAAGQKGDTGLTGPTGGTGPQGAGGNLGAYGDGSNGAMTISSNTNWIVTNPGSNLQFTTFTVNPGVTLTVPSGTMIRATGNVAINGAIVVATAASDSGQFRPNPGVATSAASNPFGAIGLSLTQAQNLMHPGLMGGGAGAHNNLSSGGQGGGSLVIFALGTITVTGGAITANGASGVNPQTSGLGITGAGGGAGGVVVLATPSTLTLTGSAMAVAGGSGASGWDGDGGNAEGAGGGGGGGIIHLLGGTLSTGGGTFNVSGGTFGTNAGGGTVVNTGGGGGACGGAGGNGGANTSGLVSAAGSGVAGYVIQTTLGAPENLLF